MNSPIRNRFAKTFVSFLFVVHIFVVIKFILLKNPADLKSHFVEDFNWTLVEKNFCEGNYIPLRTFNYYLTGIAPAKFSKENLLGNIFLFVPFGILLPVLFNKADGLFKIMMICFLISLSLETIQLATALGTFDVDDILLNTLGSMLGYGIYAVARNLMRKQQGHNSE